MLVLFLLEQKNACEIAACLLWATRVSKLVVWVILGYVPRYPPEYTLSGTTNTVQTHRQGELLEPKGECGYGARSSWMKGLLFLRLEHCCELLPVPDLCIVAYPTKRLYRWHLSLRGALARCLRRDGCSQESTPSLTKPLPPRLGCFGLHSGCTE